MSRADDLADIESGLLAMRGMNNAVITAAKVLTDSETGFLLADAIAAGFPITLPPANRIMDVRVQRVDNTGNRLVIQAAAGEKILFHTHLRPAGYPFFVLMGSGDFWHLRSDANGFWRVLDCMDSTPLGRPVFETTTAFQPGGWVGLNGFTYNRADWPWVWDHAQQSGMLTTEALRAGLEGSWTSGDGLTTFRSPDGRGEFLRMLDESRGVDADRAPGSSQKGTAIAYDDATNLGVAGWKAINSADNKAVTFSADTVPRSDYPLATTAYATASATSTIPVGATRPRNIAYPGRLKMI